MNDQIEIRLLGRLWIRAANGVVVSPSQWTSPGSADLLRLLALRSDQIVSSASLIENLWPDARPQEAAASLRSAIVQIREVLGQESIPRHLNGLQLQGCWVDVAAYGELGAEIANAIRSRQYAQVVASVKKAEAIYVDDFHATDDESIWANDVRDQLRGQRRTMLVDAAESAIELGWMRDAIGLSTLAISLDPCYERAHRALMRAYTGVGELDSATRSYERCRRNLHSALGVPPSDQTETLHLQLTWPSFEMERDTTYVGREACVSELSDAIRHAARGEGTGLVCVVGSPGSGRETLLQTAVDLVPGMHLRPVCLPDEAHVEPETRTLERMGLTDVTVMGPVDHAPDRALTTITDALETIPPRHNQVLVVITTPETFSLLKDANNSPYEPMLIESPALDRDELIELARTILAGPPSAGLVNTLEERSGSLAGDATTILREWVATGQFISTVRGLGLVSASLSSTVLPAASATFRVLAEQLSPTDMELCQVMAVLDRPASASEIMEIHGSERKTENRQAEITARMDFLTLRGIFLAGNDHYTFRDRTTQDLFELWLSPSLRARISNRIGAGHPGVTTKTQLQ